MGGIIINYLVRYFYFEVITKKRCISLHSKVELSKVNKQDGKLTLSFNYKSTKKRTSKQHFCANNLQTLQNLSVENVFTVQELDQSLEGFFKAKII